MDRVGSNLSVMFWIHGGSYLFGSGEGYPVFDLALLGDVIVVTINYRLNTLGWLSTGMYDITNTFRKWNIKTEIIVRV